MAPKFKNITWSFVPVKSGALNDSKDLRRRAINLYKAWHRQIPVIFYDYHMPLEPEVGRSKLREIYVKNSQITDPKVINHLIMKGEMELNETVNKQKEECHLWKYFRTTERRPQSFLTKFLEGR